MKTVIYSSAISLLFLAACTADGPKNQMTTEITAPKNKDAESISPKKTIASDGLLNAYLKLKNALASDNDKDAAAAGNEMVAAFADFDQASLSAEQLKNFVDIQDVGKEHAEHIAENIGNISHQREHLDMLSKDIYDLVKLLGTSVPLYVDHCPMYNDNKGAIWLSEVKDIRNPYLGTAMPACGTIKEELN